MVKTQKILKLIGPETETRSTREKQDREAITTRCCQDLLFFPKAGRREGLDPCQWNTKADFAECMYVGTELELEGHFRSQCSNQVCFCCLTLTL